MKPFVAASPDVNAPSVRAFPGHHFNAITSWAVDPKGEVRHVYA